MNENGRKEGRNEGKWKGGRNKNGGKEGSNERKWKEGGK